MENIWQQLSKEISDRIAQAGRSIVAVDSHGRHTSAGIVWNPEFVLTSALAVPRDNEVGIIFESGKVTSARVTGRAPALGVALLKLDRKIDGIPAEFGSTNTLSVGELVVAIARTHRGNIVASSGILSGLMGEWQTGPIRIDQFIRPDLTLYSGFSGGGLIGADGKIIGMMSAEFLRGKPIAIPPTTLVRVAEEIATKGHIATPYIGLAMEPVAIPESLRQRSGVDEPQGLLVMHVENGGPADAGGVIVGDILFNLDGEPFENFRDFQSVLRRRGVGQEVKAGLIRGGQKIELKIHIGERPLR
jgi:S1-C subfamily serine protease